jgi:hypothetical protein
MRATRRSIATAALAALTVLSLTTATRKADCRLAAKPTANRAGENPWGQPQRHRGLDEPHGGPHRGGSGAPDRSVSERSGIWRPVGNSVVQTRGQAVAPRVLRVRMFSRTAISGPAAGSSSRCGVATRIGRSPRWRRVAWIVVARASTLSGLVSSSRAGSGSAPAPKTPCTVTKPVAHSVSWSFPVRVEDHQYVGSGWCT